MDFIKQQLKQIRKTESAINPDKEWIVANKQRLMRQIENTVQVDHREIRRGTLIEFAYIVRSANFVRIMKPALTALVVAMLATGGWIASVSASFNSLPGDTLWGMKRAAQNTEVAVKSFGASQERKAKLQLNLAKNRADDVKKVIAERYLPEASKERAKAVKDINVAVKDVQAAVKLASESVNTQVREVVDANPQQAVEIVQGVTKDVADIAKTLVEAVPQTTSVGVEVAKEVMETVKVATESSLTAIEAVVIHDEITSSTTATAVKDIINDKLTELVKTAEGIQQDVRIVKELVKQGDSGITQATSTSLSSVGQGNMIVTNTAPVVPSVQSTTTGTGIIQNTSNSITATANSETLIRETEARTTAIQESMGEVRKSIDGGNLREAVNQLRSINESTVGAQRLLVETKSSVEIKN